MGLVHVWQETKPMGTHFFFFVYYTCTKITVCRWSPTISMQAFSIWNWKKKAECKSVEKTILYTLKSSAMGLTF